MKRSLWSVRAGPVLAACGSPDTPATSPPTAAVGRPGRPPNHHRAAANADADRCPLPTGRRPVPLPTRAPTVAVATRRRPSARADR